MRTDHAPHQRQIKFNGWSGLRYLDTVHRLNQRSLALLMEAAQGNDPTDGFVALTWILPLWARPSERTLTRAMQFPMVLLDFNFQLIDWWRGATRDCLREGSTQPSLSGLRIDQAVPLARDLLMEAWSASRSMPATASLVFGMAPEVTALVARLSPSDIDRVVLNETRALKLRWDSRPAFWKDLFQAAAQMDDEALANVHLHSLQLLGGELAVNRSLILGGVDAGTKEVSARASQGAKRSPRLTRLSFAENSAKPAPPAAPHRAVIATNQMGGHKDVIDSIDTSGTG
jgi:hypothetical protein